MLHVNPNCMPAYLGCTAAGCVIAYEEPGAAPLATANGAPAVCNTTLFQG